VTILGVGEPYCDYRLAIIELELTIMVPPL